jgi:hypothetical protein
MLTVVDLRGRPSLWVVGGRGGDNSVNGGPEVYFNDIWTAPLSGNQPTNWERLEVPGPAPPVPPEDPFAMPWEPRTGHTVALEPGTPANQNVRTLYLYGGFNNGTFLDDCWAWRLDDSEEMWRQDFTPAAYYSTGVGSDFVYRKKSPSAYYVTPDSDLSMMQRFWVPTDPPEGDGIPLERRTYLTEEDVATMKSVGLHTIRDLADAGLYTVLKLRGFDYPQVPMEERLHLDKICDYRALAIGLVQKCSLNLPSLYDGERNMPWNIEPEFGGPPPFSDNIAWHGRPSYDFLLPETDDPEVLLRTFISPLFCFVSPFLPNNLVPLLIYTILLCDALWCDVFLRSELGRLHVHAADPRAFRPQCRRTRIRGPSEQVGYYCPCLACSFAYVFLWKFQYNNSCFVFCCVLRPS